jgi:hypothetical protein
MAARTGEVRTVRSQKHTVGVEDGKDEDEENKTRNEKGAV